MKKSFLSAMNSKKNSNAGYVLKMVLAMGLAAFIYTYVFSNPSFLQGAAKGYSGDSTVCNCSATSRLEQSLAKLSHAVAPKANMSILLGVLTMASKVERRNILRLAYGIQKTEIADVTLKFVIGKPKNDEEKLAVGLESLRHGDVIILDCEENMNNGKSFMYFSTIAAMGVHYDYVMKLDDDSYVRTDNLAKSLAPLSRTDLYYGYVLPCENQDPYAWYMAGMGYIISWDLVQWVSESPVVRNSTAGTEDKLMGDWLNAGGKAKNRVSKKPLFYDHPEFGGKCAHELIPESILVHQVKNDKRWFDVLKFFEGDRIGDLIVPAIKSQAT